MSTETDTGVKLLSAFPRALIPLNQTGSIHPGLLTVQIPLPAMPNKSIIDQYHWPLTRNYRFRFSGSVVFTSAGPTEVSIESCAMVLTDILGDVLMSNAGRLSSLTALAQDVGLSFDEWLVDTNDLLSLLAGAAQLPTELRNNFKLWIYIVANNNAGSAPKQYNAQGFFQSDAAQFDNYRFSKWE